jgi:rsbT co-antagonist protein RsbR
MPLVGALDNERLDQAQERALQFIQTMGARYLILDITGVPVVDTLVAKGLMLIVQTTRLLGCRAVLVGIRPEVAQTLVGLGIDLQGVTTAATLQEGVAYTLRQNISGRGSAVTTI